MSKPVIYAFLSDDALRMTGKVDTLTSEDQGYGVLSGETANYLVEMGILNDTRKNRLSVLNNEAPFGRISLLFDTLRTDMDMLDSLSDIEYILLFNIIERLAYQQEYSDENIEHILRNNSAFSGYVPGSMMHGTYQKRISVWNHVRNLIDDRPFWDVYSFDFETDHVSFKLHFWISNQAFKKDYPYVTITNVIPPCEPALLINPISLMQSGNLNILTSGANFIFANMNLEALSKDQNGVYTYYTKYRLDATKHLMLPFALPYCGAKVPSSLECRKAIREYLERNTDLSSGDMGSLFEELYVNSRFFIVPLWDRYKQLADREVYPSIISLKDITDRANLIFQDRDKTFVDNYMEVLLCAQNKMFYLSLPDELNSEVYSILKQHPTYQDYSTQAAAGFRYMAPLTQDFAGKFNRCMSILSGENTDPEFTREQVNNLWYLTFTSGKSEYFVMEKLSYMDLISVRQFPVL